MNFLAVALILLPFVACTQLRAGLHKAHQSPRQKWASKADISTMNLPGSYPTNPTFVSVSFWNDTSCTSFITGTTAYLTDVCFSGSRGSEMFTCASTGAVWNTYNDASCGSLNSTLSVSTSCEDSGTTMFSCGPSSSSTALSHPVQDTYYNTQGCNSDVIQVNSVQNNYCYYLGGSGSSKFVWPTMSSYASNDCTGNAQTQNLASQGCFHDTDDYYNDYVTLGSYDSWSYSTSGASKNIVLMNFGLATSVMMFVMQLWNN